MTSDLEIYKNLPRIRKIHLDGLVVLQILKHCHENIPKSVAGSLLGLENHEILEITYSFPSPMESSGSTSSSNNSNETLQLGNDSLDDQTLAENDLYQLEMMKLLRDINIDNNKIGWYQCCMLERYCNLSSIESQYQYQHLLGPNAICLVYDPSKTNRNYISLKGYRLTETFYQCYHEKKFTKEQIKEYQLTSEKIWEEIPIEIQNHEIIQCWLMNYHQEKNVQEEKNSEKKTEEGGERVVQEKIMKKKNGNESELVHPYLESTLEHLNLWSSELINQYNKYQMHDRKQKFQYQQAMQKRKEEGNTADDEGFKNLSPINRLESILLTKQMNIYCDQLSRYTHQGINELYMKDDHAEQQH